MSSVFSFRAAGLTFLALLILFCGTASKASAQAVCLTQGQPQSFTYTSSFGAQGSARATFTLQGNVLTVTYRNTSTTNTFLNGIGFDTNPHLLPENLSNATATGGWSADAGPGGGLGNYDLIAYGTGRNRLSPNTSGTAVFILTTTPQQLCIEVSIAHLTSLPNGDSEKPVGVAVPPEGGPGGGGPISE